MKDSIEPLFVHRTGGPISSSPLVVDANADGWPEIFVGGSRLHGLTWDGESLPRWPKRGRRPFASSPAFGDINGDGRGEIVVGCDDGGVHAFYLDGDRVAGWPVKTGADVFSTPALADLDGDRALEVIVGSDDGGLYVFRGDGSLARTTLLSGRPFVSASPTVADLDGDGNAEVAIGAWDRAMQIWSPDRSDRPTAVHVGRHVVWSSATAFEVADLGLCLVWASDRVYMTTMDGRSLPGWPRRTQSWMVSSPAVVDLGPTGPAVIVGADRLYAWDLGGRPLPGWPVDVGDYVWSSPIALDVDGDGFREIIVGSWDGGLYAVRADGAIVTGFPLCTGGPIFATPAAAPLPDGGGLLVAASWDGTVRGWRLAGARFGTGDWRQFRGSPQRIGMQTVRFEPAHTIGPAETLPNGDPQIDDVRVEPWSHIQRIALLGHDLAAATRLELVYQIPGDSRRHPVPVVNSRGRFVALVQPLRLPRRIEYHVELETLSGQRSRWPIAGSRRFLAGPHILSSAATNPQTAGIDS